MRKVVVIDTGPIISLAVIKQLRILEKLFNEICIPEGVWKEIKQIKDRRIRKEAEEFFKRRIRKIKGKNILRPFIDYGESEAIILIQEIKGDYLIIDDKKAREIAEALGIRCIGTLGILYKAKEKGIIKELRKLFIILIKNKRYYKKEILNYLLTKAGEDNI